MSRKLDTGASGVIAAAVMLSRLLGLVREMLFAALFGSGLMGLFTVAFRAPNLLRDLFAEGALSTAFVTVFSKKIELEGRAAAWRLAAKMMTLTAVFMSGVSLLGVLLAPQLVGVLAMGFAPEEAGQVVLLTRIMFPFILLVSLAALAMGMLNACGIFGIPALASSFFNLGSIAGGALLGWWMDPSFGPRALAGLAVGTLLGGFLQLAIQLPALRRAGFPFHPDFQWRDPGVSQILALMLPSVIAASAVQINVLVNTSFASFLGKEAVAWLNFAFRFMQLPLGVFGVAVATITLPVVSRIAASSQREDFGPTLSHALRLAIFLTLPASVGLWLLAGPIIGLVYERGEFTAHDTAQTALALQFYALGLCSYAGVKVLSPAFYALDRRWTPMVVSFAAIGLNLALNYVFIFELKLGHRGLALATSLSALFNFLALAAAMRRSAGRLEGRRMLATLARCAVACLPLGAICLAGTGLLGNWIAQGQAWTRAPALLGLIGLAALSYGGTCWVLGVEEARDFAQAFLRRLQHRAGLLTPKRKRER